MASRIEEAHSAALTEKAKDIVRTWKRLLDASQQREHNAALAVSDLRAKLKAAEAALDGASDALRYCVEQCELELGHKMVAKLCDDGHMVERAIAAIRDEGSSPLLRRNGVEMLQGLRFSRPHTVGSQSQRKDR